MIQKLTLIFLIGIASFAMLRGQSVVQSQSHRRELTLQEKRGKAFYLRGESSSGQEITAMMGDVDVPATTLTCAGCHGMRGEGKTEGGVTAGTVTWSYLTKPYGHVDDGGRKHAAFSETSFIRMLTAGFDPAGNKLAVAMPTYRMPQQDMANLIAYLKRIETDVDPGISETNIVIGTLLPERSALTGLAQSIEGVLQAYFAEINSHGGIYSRRIELHALNGNSAATVTNMKHLIEDDQVFAFVSGLTAGAEEGVAALSRESEVPFIGPTTLLPERSLPLNRYIFYLLPGLKEQVRTLVNFAGKKTDLKKARVAIISPDTEFSRGISASVEDQGTKIGWNLITSIHYPREGFNAQRHVAELNTQRIDTVFLLGSETDAAAFFKDAETANWSPSVYLLGTLLGRNAPEIVPVKMKDKVFLAFPTIPADISAAGAAEYKTLLQKNSLSSTHAAAQASAIAAAQILVHALKVCGKDLSREKLITTLEGLYEFDTGLMPKLTFGPNRRIGALGAYVVTIDPVKKLFPASVEWITVE